MHLEKEIPIKLFAVDLCVKSQVNEELCACVCIWPCVCMLSCFVRRRGKRKKKRKMNEGKRGVIFPSTLKGDV